MLRRVFAVLQRAVIASLIVAVLPDIVAAQDATTRPIAARSAAVNDDGEWRMAAKDYANARYSSLDQINTTNAKDLKVAWTFSTGIDRGHEAAPLVVGDMMYVVTPHPNYLVIQNTPENLVHWILDPPSIDSKTAMPNLKLSETDARDIAGYLYTLH